MMEDVLREGKGEIVDSKEARGAIGKRTALLFKAHLQAATEGHGGVMTVEIRHGDCIEVMRSMSEASVDAVVCDPPYGLEFMGKDWDHGCPGIHFWQEALRVAKPGAHLLAFGGTRTFHRLTCAIEDAGWEIRDCLGWIYGSGFPKSHNLHDGWQGWGTALKPAWEPIILARKPLEGTVAANVLKHGTGGLNIDGCRVESKPRLTGTRTDGDEIQAKPSSYLGSGTRKLQTNYDEKMTQNNLGRWPANLIHDGSEEVLELFPVVKGGTWCRTKGMRPFNNNGEDTGHSVSGSDTSVGSAARFFYCAKASKSDRDEGCEDMPIKTKVFNGQSAESSQDMKPVEERFTTQGRNNHPTVKPTSLMRYLCKLITPPNGTILDPFMGSGSTGKAAVMEGFSFIGIEKEKEYIEIAKARISAVRRQETLAL